MKTSPVLSDADTRRASIVESAIAVFAASGYASTPVAAVATAAGISQAYVFKLYPTKEMLFVAAVDRCYERIEQTLAESAGKAKSNSPDDILWAMGDGYARLIADRDILMLQVHAQGAADVSAIKEAVHRGLARVVRFVKARSGADDAAVKRFIAFGQLCHLVTTLGLTGLDEDWARTVSSGLRHFD